VTPVLPAVADVVCVGGGLGGLAVAAAATAAGLDAVVLEAGDTVGGAAAYSGGLLWAPGAPPDSVAAADTYLAHIQGERRADDTLRRSLLDAAVEAMAAYADLGVPFAVVPGNPDVHHPHVPGSVASGRMFEVAVPGALLGEARALLAPSPHYRIGLTHAERHGGELDEEQIEKLYAERQAEDHLTMGSGLVAAFLHAARAATVVTGARVDGLVVEDGTVTGVRIGDRTITARCGVVLTAGGYGWAEDAADLDALPDLAEAGPPTLRGDHLGLAAEAGAAVVRGSGPQFALGAQVRPTDVHPGTDAPLVSQLFDVTGLPHTLVVNRAGRRFGDESYYVGINVALAAWDPATRTWPNVPCWLVVDDEFRRRYPLATVAADEP
jgi:3-oxosteroid 1-dehydrogenase